MSPFNIVGYCVIGAAALGGVLSVGRAVTTRRWRPLGQAGIGLVSGFVTGLIWSVGGRLAMRVFAVAIGNQTRLTQETVGILFIGCFIGACLGLVFVAVAPWLRIPVGKRGLVFGLAVFAVAWIPFSLIGAEDLRRPLDAAILAGGLLVTSFWIPYGMVLGALIKRFGLQSS